MEIRSLSDASAAEVGGDVQESTALKREGLVADIGNHVLTANEVTFRPGERTRLHKHDYGQLLYVTKGRGSVATADGPERAVSEGDLIFFPPGEVHWHGTSTEDATEFAHLTAVVRDDVDGGTTAVGDREE